MSKVARALVVFVLACAVVAVFALKARKRAPVTAPWATEKPTRVAATSAVVVATQKATETKDLPRLVDLGAGKCIPCKMMAPILEELKEDFAGTFEVEFIDVWENPEAGEKYGIRVIPTQIFFDAEGKELFRHEGFFGKKEILAKWKECGVTPATQPQE